MDNLHFTPQKRGFALLSGERRREIASRGGKAAQKNGKAHRWSTDEARSAGRKGGLSTHTPQKK